ncbi:hypothetical protein B0H14DRAFT_2603638 [Mycena olivaceomarginata]|nr:hypothetical protein B0H14DRAFT_2603638 [Mycena olivaceomarginata]
MPAASHPEYGNKISLSAEGLWISARHYRSKRKAEESKPCAVLPLLQRWHQPPLSYYTPVSGTVTAILTPLELLLTRPYKSNGGVTPAISLVLADLLSLKHDLVQYADLCSWQEVPMESMSSVFVHMFNSQLSAPFDNQRIVGLMDIAGTPEGTLRCRFDFPAMVSHLGPNFAFHDNNYQFSPDELKKLFPPVQHEPVELSRSTTKATLLADQQATVAARAVDLAKHGKELYFSSVWTPRGWFTDTHVDGNGTSQILVHVEGEKLWLVYPATEKIWLGGV